MPSPLHVFSAHSMCQILYEPCNWSNTYAVATNLIATVTSFVSHKKFSVATKKPTIR